MPHRWGFTFKTDNIKSKRMQWREKNINNNKERGKMTEFSNSPSIYRRQPDIREPIRWYLYGQPNSTKPYSQPSKSQLYEYISSIPVSLVQHLQKDITTNILFFLLNETSSYPKVYPSLSYLIKNRCAQTCVLVHLLVFSVRLTHLTFFFILYNFNILILLNWCFC